jgi:hypothetical protein
MCVAGKRFVVHQRVSVRRARRLVRRTLILLFQCAQLRIFVERLPLLRRLVWRVRLGGGRWLRSRRRFLAGQLGAAAHGSERFALGAFDLGRVGAAAAFEVQVLADGVVE